MRVVVVAEVGVAGLTVAHGLRRGVRMGPLARSPALRQIRYQLNVQSNGMYALSDLLAAFLKRGGSHITRAGIVEPYGLARRLCRVAMPSVQPTEDVQPLTAFLANVASFIAQLRRTGRPLVLTQHGRSAADLRRIPALKVIICPR